MAFRRTLGSGSTSVFGSSSSSDGGTSVTVSSSNGCTTDYEITDSGNTTMKVVVRVRPENEMEIRSNFQSVVKTLDEHVLVFDPLPDNEPTFRATNVAGDGTGSLRRRPILGKKYKDLRFAFDHVFDETASQTDVFKRTTESIIDGVLDGINCSVFAYGATGAGKTHTMLGNQDYPGVMFYTMMELYRRIDELKDDKICEVAVSYCEVYNETIRDLLVPSAPLHLREDGQKGLVVAGLSRHTPKTANEILSMLEIGNRNRTQHPTDANATSSRSHAVFQVFVHQKARTAGLSAQVTSAKMSLIDLAGSERATVTTNRGARLREGANINKSLLALGNCINALADNKGKAVHVPYRNSKLTRLLKDSLGGNCRTVMIANISPSGMSYEDTYNTLKYADRAKQIKTKLVRNVVSVDFHVTKYKTIVIELRREITELKAKLDKKPVLPSRQTYDPAEASRLQGLVKAVYSERCRLRKQMAELDTSEREALLKVSRKERDIVRIDTTSANETKKAKIHSRIDHLRKHVDEVHGQKEALNERLCANNEAIGRVQAEINTACGDSNKPGVQALRQLIETFVEARKLEAENAHQWRLTKLLLKFIKNQEREISKSEKLLVFSLGLVQRQHTMIRASQISTPSLQESYETLVRMAEGEKGVAWADQSNLSTDNLMDVSTSNFTQSQHALFDNLLVSASPRARQSDIGISSMINSPFPISTSLGILATSSTVTHTPRSGSHEATPLSSSTFRSSTAATSGGVATPKSYHTEPRIPTPSSLFQRRVAQQNENDETPSGFTGSSPFIHQTTVSAGGVKCETSIGGVRAVTIASSGSSGLDGQHSASKVQISTSTSGMADGSTAGTPLRVTTTTRATAADSSSRPSSKSSPTHYNLDEVDSRLSKFAAVSHSHFNKSSSGSDFSSSQGSASMYSTQCVVTNRHTHAGSCSPRKFSDPDVKSGLPGVASTSLRSQPPRPKSANEVLRPKSSTQAEESSGRLTAFTPLRGSASDINKISTSQTPTAHSSNSVGGAQESRDVVGSPKEQRVGNPDGSLACTRTDSGYSTTLSELSRNGNGTGDIASPYLIPRPGTGSKQRSDSHSNTTKRQPAFQISAINVTNPSQSCTFASLSSQSRPSTHADASPSQQSLSLSMSSDTSSTHCVVDMNLSSRPKPAFQLPFPGKSAKSDRLPTGGSSISAPNVSSMATPTGSTSREVRTMFLPTQKFCSFEDDFVPSSQSFGVPKTPVGAATATANFGSQSSPLRRRQLPPASSVSSRSNYLTSAGYHSNHHASPRSNNYTRSPSHHLLTNPYSRSDQVGGDYYRDGAKSAPFYSSSRSRSDRPPQSPGTYTRFYPASRTCTISPDPPILTPPSPIDSCSDSRSDSTSNTSSHIYQSIENGPPPLPPPRTHNNYVPSPRGTPSSYASQHSYTNVIHTGSTSHSRPYEASKTTDALNETFTIDSVSSHAHKTSPYHHHRNHHHHHHHHARPTSAPDRDRVRGSEKSNPYAQHPPAGQSVHGARYHQQQYTQGVDRKVPNYLQMTKSAASKRVPRERKHSSTSSHQLHVDGISSSHSHVRKAQDKENRGRGQPSSKNHSKTTLVSSSSKWNRRLPSTSSNGSGSAFVKPVKLHHGNGMPIGGGGLLRSREPTTAVA